MTIRNPADGHGATLTFAGFEANKVSITGPSWVREAMEASHLSTVDWKQFIPADLADPGEISGECQFDPQALPPILGDADTIEIVWGNEEGDAFECEGFMTNFSVNGATSGELMKASFTFKCTGAPTITPGS